MPQDFNASIMAQMAQVNTELKKSKSKTNVMGKKVPPRTSCPDFIDKYCNITHPRLCQGQHKSQGENSGTNGTPSNCSASRKKRWSSREPLKDLPSEEEGGKEAKKPKLAAQDAPGKVPYACSLGSPQI